MALKWTNKRDLDLEFIRAKEEYDRKAIVFLQSVGERVVKYAREHGSYTDQTGNLRHSIGYVIIQYGKVVSENFSSGNGYPEAQQEAREAAMKVASELPKMHTYLVWVAGMEYARYVEARGYDVIQGSGNWVESNVESLKEEFRRYLKSKKA